MEEIWGIYGFVLTVVILVICMSWQMAAARGSINSANNSGESGHPCLVPQFNVKRCEVIPLVITDAVGELYKILIHLINDSKAKPV